MSDEICESNPALLLCPLCFNNIPRIKLIKENNEIVIVTMCFCSNIEYKMALSKYISIMEVNYNRLDSTKIIMVDGLEYCSNCLCFFCNEAYDCHLINCLMPKDKEETNIFLLNKIYPQSIWYCKKCNMNICYKCKEKHKYHDTKFYLLENNPREKSIA